MILRLLSRCTVGRPAPAAAGDGGGNNGVDAGLVLPKAGGRSVPSGSVAGVQSMMSKLGSLGVKSCLPSRDRTREDPALASDERAEAGARRGSVAQRHMRVASVAEAVLSYDELSPPPQIRATSMTAHMATAGGGAMAGQRDVAVGPSPSPAHPYPRTS